MVTDIANPNVGNNAFSNIKIKAQERSKPSNPLDVDNFGEYLNKIGGKEVKSRFIDRTKHNSLGKDGFLKLLSHQLANQDPLKPMDQKRFAADLAQFSQLEQLTNLNSKMNDSHKNIPTESKFYGASFLGKKVLTSGSSVEIAKEGGTTLPFYINKSAKKAIVRVFDSSNNLIRQLETDILPAGRQAINWDGRSEDGAFVSKGIYKFTVTAFDNEYNKFSGETRSEGTVTGVNFDRGETFLIVDGERTVSLRDVKQFSMPENKGFSQNMASVGKVSP